MGDGTSTNIYQHCLSSLSTAQATHLHKLTKEGEGFSKGIKGIEKNDYSDDEIKLNWEKLMCFNYDAWPKNKLMKYYIIHVIFN